MRNHGVCQRHVPRPALHAAQIEICLWVVITVALPAMVSDPRLPFFQDAQTGVVLASGTLGSVVSQPCLPADVMTFASGQMDK